MSDQQEPIFEYQEKLDEETKKTFGFSLFEGRPYVLSFRELLNDMLKADMEVGALKVLFDHCRRENKTHTNYFRVVVNKWLDNGVSTQQEAEKALREHRMAKFSTSICKKPNCDCLNNNCQFSNDCSVFKVLKCFDEKINPEVSAVTLEDKKMIEDRLNSIFTTQHLFKAIDNFAKSKYHKEGETRLGFIFRADRFTKDWVNRVVKKKSQNTESADNKKTIGKNLSKEESLAHLEQMINQEGRSENGGK